MKENEAMTAEPELEDIPECRKIEVWARIRKSSKYYHQGLVDPTNSKSEVRFFKLAWFNPLFCGLALSKDQFCLHFNGNQYRLEDCEIFLRDATDPKKFLRLT